MSRVAGRILGADQAHQRGLDGGGEIIAICDTGLDRGDPRDPHPYISADRVLMLQVYRRKVGDDLHGHGTHVAGCAVADSQNGPQDVLGTAPGAQLVLQSVFRANDSPFGNRPLHVSNVLRDAYDRGARIHSNSWIQVDVGPLYSDTAREIDAFVTAQPDLVVVSAVGNEGRFDALGRPQRGTVCSPSTAKNCIAVGASESEQPALSKSYDSFFPRDLALRLPASVAADGWANSRTHWAPFSGVGPTSDKRVRPDVVAPSTAIHSARSRRRFVNSIWGTSSLEHGAVLGGTSIAAPLVAGCCALVRQSLRSLGLASPSAALVKAVLINGTDQDLEETPGQRFATYPNDCVGWGRVNVARSLALGAGGILAVHESARPLAHGDVARLRVPLTSAGQVAVTLAWTDPPADGLRSDLDLSVEHNGEVLLGNQQPGANSADRINNVEHVRFQADSSANDLIVKVSAHRLDSGPQSFALAIAGPIDRDNIVPA